MNAEERRVVEALQSHAGGLTVTEQDIHEAHLGLREILDAEPARQPLRPVVLAFAAAVALVAGVAVFQSLGGEDRSAPPSNPGPTVDQHADFLTGSEPTPELLQGVWRVDDGTTLLRFDQPNLVSIDNLGRLFDGPVVSGTYAIEGDLVTITVDGGEACRGQEFAFRATVAEPNIAHVVHTRPGVANCAREQDEEWVLEQVLPTYEGLAEVTASGGLNGWERPADVGALEGDWLAQGGGYLLEIDPGGTYYVADDTGVPVDTGTWSYQASKLDLTSGAGSESCAAGDRLVVTDVEQLIIDDSKPDVRAQTGLRGTVAQNECDSDWGGSLFVWVLLPPALP